MFGCGDVVKTVCAQPRRWKLILRVSSSRGRSGDLYSRMWRPQHVFHSFRSGGFSKCLSCRCNTVFKRFWLHLPSNVFHRVYVRGLPMAPFGKRRRAEGTGARFRVSITDRPTYRARIRHYTFYYHRGRASAPKILPITVTPPRHPKHYCVRGARIVVR